VIVNDAITNIYPQIRASTSSLGCAEKIRGKKQSFKNNNVICALDTYSVVEFFYYFSSYLPNLIKKNDDLV